MTVIVNCFEKTVMATNNSRGLNSTYLLKSEYQRKRERQRTRIIRQRGSVEDRQRELGPVARSLVSTNRWLRGIKMYRFPWYLTLVSTNHASSNPGLVSMLHLET